MFLNFVKHSKFNLDSSKLKWLVLGNEATDLDSVISSLVYAYLKQSQIGDHYHVIPVCCISKDNIKLKKDVHQWLSSFCIDRDTDLVHLVDVEHLISNAKISLLDHHKPQLPMIAEHVREVIDHREIVFHYPKGQLEVNNVKLVGSCCTLIAQYIMTDETLTDREVLLEMLRGVILLDTDGLLINNGKTTKQDIETVEYIERCLSITSDTRQTVYQNLFQAKSDLSDLSIDLIIQRDLKILEVNWNNSSLRMAIPTLINIDIEDLLYTKDVDIQLATVLDTLKVDILIGLTCGTTSQQRRGYLIYSNNFELNDQIATYLLLPEHGLELNSLVTEMKMKAFYQNSLHTTRKLFIPIIEKFFKMENEKHFSKQINNCSADVYPNFQLSVKTSDYDCDDEVEEIAENEGAPYSLNTPLRSYSASPDNRKSDIALPTLNNRYTQLLVDRKRQKHHAELDEDPTVVYYEGQDLDKTNNDDISPRTFTPENTDDELISDSENDCKGDNLSSLSSMSHYLSNDKIKSKPETSAEQTIELLSTSGHLPTNDTNIPTIGNTDSKPLKHLTLKKEEITDTEFKSLEEKVDKKRQKLESSHIASIADILVNDVVQESEDMLIDETNVESMLKDWSRSVVDDEKKEIVTCLNSNDITKLAELLTNSLIRDCLQSEEIISSVNEVDANNSATEVDVDKTTDPSSHVESISDEDSDSCSGPESPAPNVEWNVYDCHLGNIIHEENPNQMPSCVNSSCADVVENSSFNLYRRISSNQLDFSADEKELLTNVCDWQPKDKVILSDPEQEECNVNHYSNSDEDLNEEIVKKVIFPDKEIFMDSSHYDMNTSTEISLNDLNNMPTPDFGIIDEMEITENVESASAKSVQSTGDLEAERRERESDVDVTNFERYKDAIGDGGYYFDATNNDQQTKLITLSSNYFPDRSDPNYQTIMQHILDYTVDYLESGDTEFYSLVYFHCFGNQQKGPSIFWLHQSYQSITYRLKKNLKHLYIVHPTIWIKAALFFSRFFINSKFYSKIQYVTELESLGNYVPTANIRIPSDVLK